MRRLIIINLSTMTTSEEFLPEEKGFDYGRGLAVKLIKEKVPEVAGRHDPRNAIIFIPGLFSGTMAPSTGRMTIATKKEAGRGVQFLNIAGPASQKIASLNISAVVVTGQADPAKPAVIIISPDGVRITVDQTMRNAKVTDTINFIRKTHGDAASVIGIGPAGEHLLPLASVFSTYPQGTPEYYCSRSEMGDVFGAKGLKALAVVTNEHFDAAVFNREEMLISAKQVAGLIVKHPVCGGALPAHGSITLMKMMKDGKRGLESLGSPSTEKHQSDEVPTCGDGVKINRTCSPRCVVGCLNRHARSDKAVFHSPAESEALAALKELFAIDEPAFAARLNRQAFELGLDSIEYIFSCALYFKAENISATKEDLLQILNDISQLNLRGRVVAGRTEGIGKMYADRRDLSEMVSRPAMHEAKHFAVNIPTKPDQFAAMPDVDYLYAYMTLLGNLGFCLFTAFAFIDEPQALELLAKMFYYRTGIKVSGNEMIAYAANCLDAEAEYDRFSRQAGTQKTIPEFVKVLYRYFGEAVG